MLWCNFIYRIHGFLNGIHDKDITIIFKGLSGGIYQMMFLTQSEDLISDLFCLFF